MVRRSIVTAAVVAVVGTAVALLVLSGVWRRGPQAPAVALIRVADGRAAPALAEAGVAAAEVEGLARTALGDAGFRVGAGGKGAFEARVELLAVRLAPGPGGAPWSQVAVALELTPAGGGKQRAALGETGRGEAPVAETPSVAWRAALEGALREAASQMLIAVAAEDKPIPALLSDLDVADPRVRERAVVVLGERRAREAVPALLTLLSSSEPRSVDLAAGALAQIRDPRAVGPLITVSRRRGPREQARFARIIGDIGGDEARGYLATLAAGASDPVVRSAAAEALSDLAAAAAAPATADR